MKLNNECVHYVSTIDIYIYALIDTNEDLWYVQIEKNFKEEILSKVTSSKKF